MKNRKILFVDFDHEMMQLYARFLENQGFEVSTSSNGVDGLNKALVLQPAIIILDLMNTEQSGLRLIRQIRDSRNMERVCLVLHTVNVDYWLNHFEILRLVDRIVEKPVAPEILEQVIYKLLDEVTPSLLDQNSLIFGSFTIDIEGYTVRKGDKVIDLTKREFELILFLASKPGKLFTRKDIIEHLWGKEANTEDRILDVYVAKLRKKLGKEIVHTLKGVGYSLGHTKQLKS